jgi:hypothetical protein
MLPKSASNSRGKQVASTPNDHSGGALVETARVNTSKSYRPKQPHVAPTHAMPCVSSRQLNLHSLWVVTPDACFIHPEAIIGPTNRAVLGGRRPVESTYKFWRRTHHKSSVWHLSHALPREGHQTSINSPLCFRAVHGLAIETASRQPA